jgi:hypothetical protein
MTRASSRRVRLGEFRASQRHAARPRCGQRGFRPRAYHCPLFLGQRSEQMPDERIDIGTEFSHYERHPVSH